jgi:hypothetical protein
MRRLFVCVLLLAACKRNPPNGAIQCNTSGGKECPTGFVCDTATNTCWKEGEAPDLSFLVNLDLATADSAGQPPDMTQPPDLTLLLKKGESCSTSGGPPCEAGLA